MRTAVEWLHDYNQAKALGFCVSEDEAEAAEIMEQLVKENDRLRELLEREM